jgi:RHS repeat-associated protein
MTNSGGAVVYRGEYDPHGNVLLETGSTTLNSHKFTGYEKDQSTGLDYANARMFSGSRGRFTKPDPIGLKAGNRRKPQSLNLYTYVGNDPANLVDTGGTCLVYWNQVSETYGYWDTVLCYELEGEPVPVRNADSVPQNPRLIGTRPDYDERLRKCVHDLFPGSYVDIYVLTMVEDLGYNFSRGGGEFRFWYPNPSSDPESQRINPNNYFSLRIDTTTLTSAQISASAGERSGDLVGIATRPSVLRDRTVYIASDYANNLMSGHIC